MQNSQMHYQTKSLQTSEIEDLFCAITFNKIFIIAYCRHHF